MTLNQLRYFITICEYRQIRIASGILHISEPSLSVSIKNLEEEFGYPLFIRRKKQLILTEEGAVFYERAKNLIKNFDSLESDMKNMKSAQTLVRIGTPHTLRIFHFSSLISSYSAEHPNVRFDITSLSSVDSVEMLKNGELDIIIANKQVTQVPEIKFWPIISTTLIGCVRKGHPLSGASGVTIPMLKDEKLVFNSAKSNIAKTITQKFGEHGLKPNLLMYSDSQELAIDMVMNHSAITFFPAEFYNNNNLPKDVFDKLAFFDLEQHFEFSVGVAILSKHSIPAAKSFFSYCQEMYPEH